MGSLYINVLVLLVIALVIWVIRVMMKGAGRSGSPKLSDWMAALPECKYKAGWKSYGIAMDEANQNIHLFDNGYSKIYPFSDIREFSSNVATGGKLHAGFGTGLGAIANSVSIASANKAQEKQNREETGLFISVKDIDRPVWRIRFSDDVGDESKQQTRWMEIFRQVVNKD